MKAHFRASFMCASALLCCTAGRLSVGTAEYQDAGSADEGGAADVFILDGGGPGATEGRDCGATCSTPAGTVRTPTSLVEAYSQVEGTWIICDKVEAGLPSAAVGVELDPPMRGDASCEATGGSGCTGNLYYLVRGPSGPVRGVGPSYEFTYEIQPGSYEIALHPDPTSQGSRRYVYSPCPVELGFPAGNDFATLVPFGSDREPPGDAGAP
jgi:hypothetical protein